MQPLRALRAVRSASAGGALPPSPERVALAEAIAAHVDHQAQRAATSAAISTASDTVWNARRRLDAAPELIERAKANVAQHMADTARGVAGTPPQTIREARNAVADAEDDLDAAKAAQDALRVQMEELDGRAYHFQNAVGRAARAVLHAEAEATAYALAAELRRMQQEMVALGDAVEWLASAGAFSVVEQHGGSYGKPADEAIRRAISRMQTPPHGWTGLAIEQPSAAAVWTAAFAALQIDPMAPLPLQNAG
ncbi:MAG: hypothetical protein ACRYHQ_14490 [Janthinobacterium lividum]